MRTLFLPSLKNIDNAACEPLVYRAAGYDQQSLKAKDQFCRIGPAVCVGELLVKGRFEISLVTCLER